jgi:hypothetical protein
MTDSERYEECMAIARGMARERDQRYEQLLASEREADHLRRALVRIIETGEGGTRSCGPRLLVGIAKAALRLAPEARAGRQA